MTTVLNIIAWSSPGTLMQDQRLDTTSRVNKPVVAPITPQKEGHGDQHPQYHPYFGNNSPATTKADPLCYHCMMKPPSICASPKRHSGARCIHSILFPRENVSQETCWHQGKDLPYHLVPDSLSFALQNICDALTLVGNRILSVLFIFLAKGFAVFIAESRGLKRRRRRIIQKNQHIRTACNTDQLTIRINAR